jgi:hypothetical protein
MTSHTNLEPRLFHRIHGERGSRRQVKRDLAVVRTRFRLQSVREPPVEVGPFRQRQIAFGHRASTLICEPPFAGIGRDDQHARTDRPVHRNQAVTRIQSKHLGHHHEPKALTR